MPAAAIVTLVLATLIIAAAALGLIRVIGHLMATLKTLRALTGGVDVVAEKTSTVPAVVSSVNASLKPVSDFAESI
ncbi:MAG TPA: hypothetical protein VFZ15_00035 [Acidimicrobiia bacterium]|jgi:hypothetical protein|nr:hypothetical protein [Acidimicrobiia bacterium]